MLFWNGSIHDITRFRRANEIVQSKSKPNSRTFAIRILYILSRKMEGEKKLKMVDAIYLELREANSRDYTLFHLLMETYVKLGSKNRMDQTLKDFTDNGFEAGITIWNSFLRHSISLSNALQSLEDLKTQGLVPNKETYVIMLSCLQGTDSVKEVKVIHAQILDLKIPLNSNLYTLLLTLYCTSKLHDRAVSLFKEMVESDVTVTPAIAEALAKSCRLHDDNETMLEVFHRKSKQPRTLKFYIAAMQQLQLPEVYEECSKYHTLPHTMHRMACNAYLQHQRYEDIVVPFSHLKHEHPEGFIMKCDKVPGKIIDKIWALSIKMDLSIVAKRFMLTRVSDLSMAWELYVDHNETDLMTLELVIERLVKDDRLAALIAVREVGQAARESAKIKAALVHQNEAESQFTRF
jgi:pentatricopeptide repeat protein